jgi:hypothetical protein
MTDSRTLLPGRLLPPYYAFLAPRYKFGQMCNSYHPGYSVSPLMRIVVLTRNGRPQISRMARNITHEWVHHWLYVHEGEETSLAFDKIYRKVRL